MAGRDDLIDERGPVMRPFLLEDTDQGKVELVKECSLRFEALFGA